MIPIVRIATLEEIHRLYQRIPEFGGLHSLADLQRRIGGAPASLLIADIDGQPAGFQLAGRRAAGISSPRRGAGLVGRTRALGAGAGLSPADSQNP